MDLLGIHFQDPWWLLLAIVTPLVLFWATPRGRHLRVIAFPGAGRLVSGPHGWKARARLLPHLFATLGVVLLAIAQARPQQGTTRENVTTEGVDIMIALDVSGSMAAEDFLPKNRLSVAREVVAEFVKRRTSDRIGLVVFAGKSLTRVPPTTDTGVLLRQLEGVEFGAIPDGTAIGSGLATSLTRLRRSHGKSRIVVLVTDGANNAGEIDPETATDLARAMEVRVHTVLVGRRGAVPIPVQVRNPVTGLVETHTEMMEVQIDEPLLKKIAERTGGDFFRATDTDALRQIFDRIDRLEKTEVKLTSFKRWRELYPPVLLAGAAMVTLGALLWMLGLRVAPT